MRVTGEVQVPCPDGYQRKGYSCSMYIDHGYNFKISFTDCFTLKKYLLMDSSNLLLVGQCAAGMYHNKETGECTLCPAGEYQPDAGQTSCLSCPYLTALNKLGAKKCPVPPGTTIIMPT